MLLQQQIYFPVINFRRKPIIQHDGIEFKKTEQCFHAGIHTCLTLSASTIEHSELPMEKNGKTAGMVRISKHIFCFRKKLYKILRTGHVCFRIAKIDHTPYTATMLPGIFLNSTFLFGARFAQKIGKHVFIVTRNESSDNRTPMLHRHHERRIQHDRCRFPRQFTNQLCPLVFPHRDGGKTCQLLLENRLRLILNLIDSEARRITYQLRLIARHISESCRQHPIRYPTVIPNLVRAYDHCLQRGNIVRNQTSGCI